MALDGIFLRHLKNEIETRAVGAKIDKIYQPNRDELVFALRGKNRNALLLLSVRANSPRIHFTKYKIENPVSPPMFCMLMRKKLTGARLQSVSQPGLERVLCLEFDSVNEMGDRVNLKIYMEIMGRYSNIILTDENDVIIDSVRRVDMSMSSQRLVLPGLAYELPPGQDKINLLDVSSLSAVDAVFGKNEPNLAKAALSVLQGISPVVSREFAGLTREFLHKKIENIRDTALNYSGTPVMIKEKDGKLIDFSFTEIYQYGEKADTVKAESFSELLDLYYANRDFSERMRVKAQDLSRLLSNATERISRKLSVQRAELSSSENREHFRIYGDLINANLYKLEKGAFMAELENFYDNGNILRIPLDTALTPAQNAQKYYREYKKAQTAEKILTEQIAKGESELLYLESVSEALARAENERELGEIRRELTDEGYLKFRKDKGKIPALSAPLEFISSDGFKILVGRNNRQNDKLTLKDSSKNDMWFHVRNMPGSHTVIVSNGQEIPVKTMEEAAALAAFHSKARNSQLVPVDYTIVKNVKKPNGSKPGMVIYDNFKTVYINPKSDFS